MNQPRYGDLGIAGNPGNFGPKRRTDATAALNRPSPVLDELAPGQSVTVTKPHAAGWDKVTASRDADGKLAATASTSIDLHDVAAHYGVADADFDGWLNREGILVVHSMTPYLDRNAHVERHGATITLDYTYGIASGDGSTLDDALARIEATAVGKEILSAATPGSERRYLEAVIGRHNEMLADLGAERDGELAIAHLL